MESRTTLRSFWYPLIFERELDPRRPVRAELLGEPLALFRDARGRVACLEDACPHRCVPLSAGEVKGGELRCSYHGWRFDGDGRCVHIPALTERHRIPEAARAAARATLVRDGIVWVYGGAPGDADPGRLEPPSFAPRFQHLVRRDDFDCHYALVMHNAVDLAHFYLHRRSVAMPTPSITRPFEWSEIRWVDGRLEGEALLGDHVLGLRARFEIRPPTTVRVEMSVRELAHVVAQYHITPLSPERSRGFAFIGISGPGPRILTRALLYGFLPLFLKGVAEDKAALRGQQENLNRGFQSRTAAPPDRFLLACEKWRQRLDDGQHWHHATTDGLVRGPLRRQAPDRDI